MRSSLRRGLIALVLVGGASASAQPGGSSDDELAAKATDPTASLMSLQLSDWYTANYHGIDDTANQIVFRAAIPFGVAGTKHIFRITQPYATSGPNGSGWIDTTLFDLMVFDQPWGRWGVGLAGTVPTGTRNLSADKWTLGPALGFVNSTNPQYNWGLFTQTFFSIAGDDSARDVGIVNLQPIFSWRLGGGRSLSLGSSALIYDTERSRWVSLQASVAYGQVVGFGGYKWRPNAELGYDFKNEPGNPKWVIRAGITLLLPN